MSYTQRIESSTHLSRNQRRLLHVYTLSEYFRVHPEGGQSPRGRAYQAERTISAQQERLCHSRQSTTGKGELQLCKEGCSISMVRRNTRELKSERHENANDGCCMCHVEELALFPLKTEDPPISCRPGTDMARLSFLKRLFCLHHTDELK